VRVKRNWRREGVGGVALPFERRAWGAETLPRTEIVGAETVAASASETGGSGWRLRRAPTSGPRRSAVAGEWERATAAVTSADGPAQQGRKEGKGEGEQAERKRANRPKWREGGK
jgi:hypothetical protein